MFFQTRTPTMPDPSAALPGRDRPILEPGLHHVNGRPIGAPYPDGLDIADFALGCFWGAEKGFWQIPGVWVTAVGYQGGYTPNATYREACSGQTGHAESVRVVFDTSQVAYDALLKHFWESHDPTQDMHQGNDVGTQYRSAIFPHTEAQRAAAIASRALYQDQLAAAGLGRIVTQISDLPAPSFYFAEDYHQQYLSKKPDGYCPDHGTGVSCPIGLSISP